MKKKIAAGLLTIALSSGTALIGTAAAGKGPNPNACAGLTNAHNKMIAAQGLDRHLDLNVHQVFSTKLLPSACR